MPIGSRQPAHAWTPNKQLWLYRVKLSSRPTTGSEQIKLSRALDSPRIIPSIYGQWVIKWSAKYMYTCDDHISNIWSNKDRLLQSEAAPGTTIFIKSQRVSYLPEATIVVGGQRKQCLQTHKSHRAKAGINGQLTPCPWQWFLRPADN